MKFLPLVLGILLSGCASGCGGHASRIEKVPEEMLRPKVAAPKVSDRHSFGDITKVRPGQWATYKDGERTFTVAAVAAAGDSLWIELIEESDPRLVSARLVSPDGVVRKACYGEISKSGVKSTVEPQTSSRTPPRGAARRSRAGRRMRRRSRSRARAQVPAGVGPVRGPGRAADAGSDPVEQGRAAGLRGQRGQGLVRRTTATSTVTLVGFGADAKPLLEPPK
jgi:hypothetical protein